MNTYDVHLVKNPNEDFGCTLVTIENRFIGRIIPGTPADRCGRLRAGDCVVMINGKVLCLPGVKVVKALPPIT